MREMPDLPKLIKDLLWTHLGAWGLTLVILASVGLYVLTHWGEAKSWPMVGSWISYATRRSLPTADPHRFAVGVANLQGDTGDNAAKQLIVRMLGDLEGIQVLDVDRLISAQGSVPEANARVGHLRAEKYLREMNAAVLVWGAVRSFEGHRKPDLYITGIEQPDRKSKQYTVEITTEFRLPRVFWNDLSDVLRLVISSQLDKLQPDDGHYVGQGLEPFIDRVRTLIKTAPDAGQWTNDERVSTQLILADACATAGLQGDENRYLEEAIALYEGVTSATNRADTPARWAASRNGLGRALAALGRRENSPEKLSRAVAIYSEALEVWTQDEYPMSWAGTRNNIGSALRSLAERGAPGVRFQDALVAFDEAALVWTRELHPMQWAIVRNNLAITLARLGERGEGVARLEDASVAFEDVLHEWTRERAPLKWAMTQNNLGAVLTELGSRENRPQSLEQAIHVFRLALGERARDIAPVDWATTQNNLGRALLLLGETRDDAGLIRQALAAFGLALEVRKRDELPYAWSTTKRNEADALASLGVADQDTSKVSEAIRIYREVLGELSPERNPFDYAATLSNMGMALVTLGGVTGSASFLKQATDTLRTALPIFQELGMTKHGERIVSSIERAEAFRRALEP